MPRARLLKPDFFRDEELCELSFVDRLLFAGLWTIADRAGRLEYRIKRIKADIFPFDEVDVAACLEALSPKFISIYDVDGRKYIQINNFEKHQRPHPRESPSTIPPFEDQGYAEATPRTCLGNALDMPSPSVAVAVPIAVAESGTECIPPQPRFSDADVRKVLDAYPLRQGLPHAHHACRQVILELARRGDADPVGKLIGIVQAYSASDVVKRGKTWSALNFFTGHWEDDPATWADRKPPPPPADPKDKYGFEVAPDNNDPLTPEAWKEINETNELFNKDRRRRDAEWRAIITGGKQARPATGTGDGGNEVPGEGVSLPVP